MKKGTKEFIDLAGSVLVLVAAWLFLSGCTRTVYAPAESVTVRTDTVCQSRLRVDSVIFRDSVAVIQRGDTVFMTKYRDRYRYRNRTDTVYRSATDSVKVRVPYPVERKLTKWEQVKMEAGGWAIGILSAVICVAVVWLGRKFRK